MADESSNTIAIIGAVTGVLSLVIAALSAAAARRSANASETSAREAQATEIRALIRELVGEAQGVLSERQRLEATSVRLVNGYQSLFALAGRSKCDREVGYIGSIQEKKSQVPDVREEASRVIENPNSLRGASSEDLATILVKLHGNLIRLTSLRQEFESELSTVEEQIRPLREKALDR
ncbi:MAG: hypothetical protein ROZ09_03620 [Thiobacillus sp.]|uniref:hypothetical protein n=1 Tax=Thiobacillus sp. TaxID=924 RepID=UPI0028960BB6|nr:hypothetical protein [Thiobacillus sp.]MDT3705891.1 hypothetical protein [Thiobacillus sp.]